MLSDIIRGIVSGVMGVVNTKLTTKANVTEITRIDAALSNKAESAAVATEITRIDGELANKYGFTEVDTYFIGAVNTGTMLQNKFPVLDSTVLADVASLQGQVSAITELAPAELDTLVEIAARVNSDADLVTLEITNREAAVAAEAAARIAADGSLDARIVVVEAACAGVPSAISAAVNGALESESELRVIADNALDARIVVLESASSSALSEQYVIDAVAAERTGRIEGIQDEATARASADTALDARIVVLESASAETMNSAGVAAAIEVETNARIASDTALDGRVATLETTVTAAVGTEITSQIAAVLGALNPVALQGTAFEGLTGAALEAAVASIAAAAANE